MSHTVKIDVQFKVSEVPQLEKAFKTLGWGFVQNSQIMTYAGLSPKNYDYAAINPEKENRGFDIGLTKNGENLEIFTDMWGGSVERTLGANLSKLKQQFALEVIADEFSNNSTISSSRDEKGNLLVEVEQWN